MLSRMITFLFGRLLITLKDQRGELFTAAGVTAAVAVGNMLTGIYSGRKERKMAREELRRQEEEERERKALQARQRDLDAMRRLGTARRNRSQMRSMYGRGGGRSAAGNDLLGGGLAGQPRQLATKLGE